MSAEDLVANTVFHFIRRLVLARLPGSTKKLVIEKKYRGEREAI